jgi:hypothetical protein
MIIDRTNRDARATHHTFLSKAGDMGRNFIGNRGLIEIRDMYVFREWHGAGTHTAITADAHVYLKMYLFFAKRSEIRAMSKVYLRLLHISHLSSARTGNTN